MKARLLLLIAAVCVLVHQSTVAFAYEDTGYDPADRDNDYPDVLITSRKVWTHEGRSFLRIAFTAEENLDFAAAYWLIRVRLDVRGNRSFDVRMELWDRDMEGIGCIARERGVAETERVEGRLHQRTYGAACRVRTDRLPRFTKTVGWQLISPVLHTGGEVDYAPNDGYYA